MTTKFKRVWVDAATEERLRKRYYQATPQAEVAEDTIEVDLVQDDTPDDLIGCMVAFYPAPELAQALALPGGEAAETLHVTLAFLPDLSPDDISRLVDVVGGFALTCSPVGGEISGFGVFTAGPEPVTYASVDLPDLPEMRQRLVEALDAAGLDVACTHGYTPHMTLAYDDIRDAPVPNALLQFNQISVAAGPAQRWDFDMTAPADDDGDEELDTEAAAAAVSDPARLAEDELIKRNQATPQAQTPHQFTSAAYPNPDGTVRCATCGGTQPDGGVCPGTDADPEGNGLTQENLSTMTLPPGAPTVTTKPRATARLKEFEALDVEPTRAFITEIDGKLLITGQAEAFTRDTEWASAASPNPFMLWMNGRFVGGEKPNRNGALWSTADLTMGQPTVQHGPLNWLHESRHIIGTIAKARLVTRDEPLDTTLEEPYIEALSGIWRWVYAEEAAVVEMASEQQKLWYSMECVSKQVACEGDGGCGAVADYMDYVNGRGATCAHMLQRSSVRRLINPTFLGGAVIVPPARPGWAGADASVLTEAASLAERAYDQAGRPDMTANEWELLMAQVVSYARG